MASNDLILDGGPRAVDAKGLLVGGGRADVCGNLVHHAQVIKSNKGVIR